MNNGIHGAPLTAEFAIFFTLFRQVVQVRFPQTSFEKINGFTSNIRTASQTMTGIKEGP